MPTTASRLPPPALSLLDDCPRSPPSYPPKHASLSSPKPAPAPSPRTEKKAPFSPPPDLEEKRLDKSDRRPDPPSDPRAEPPSDSRAPSSPASKERDNGKKKEEQEEQTAKVDAAGVARDPIIDFEVFGQILELDDDESYEFSRSMVEDFYSQAEATFELMDSFFNSKDLSALSDKGHFLKGSSAAIGITKVQRSCEEIQNYGKLQGKDEKPIPIEEAQQRLEKVLIRVRVEYEEAKNWLNQWFNDPDIRREHEVA